MKKLPKSQVEFELEIPWEDWKKYLNQAAAEASEEIKIPGFRPGKAPRHLVEQKIGKGPVVSGAAERAVKKSYADFVLKEKLEVIGAPQIELLEAEEGGSLKCKVVASLMPEIQVDEKYISGVKKINLDYQGKKAEPSEEDLSLELDKLAASRVKLVTVLREAKKGDSVEIDFSVFLGGVAIENGTSRRHPLILGRGVFIPGFEENLIGMKEGEEKEFELEFPESYHKKDLAGKKASFKVKMDLVQERQTPEIDDAFAQSLGKFANLEELKKNMREGLEHENLHRLKDQKRNDYVEEIVKNSVIDLPDVLVEKESEKMMLEFEQQLAPLGVGVDEYLSQIKKDKKELEKDWEPQARKRVISSLAIAEISRQEKLTADSQEIEMEMNKTLQYYKSVKDAEKNIDMERLYAYAKGVLESEKVFEYLEAL